jgi:hypothetical protein
MKTRTPDCLTQLQGIRTVNSTVSLSETGQTKGETKRPDEKICEQCSFENSVNNTPLVQLSTVLRDWITVALVGLQYKVVF